MLNKSINIENVEIKIKDIAPHEWGEYFDGIDDYKKLQIQIDDDYLHILLGFTDLSDKFCNEVNSIWGDDRNPFYKNDFTGFWLEFPKDWGKYEEDNSTLKEIEEIAIKYYLIAKYDKPSYHRRGLDINKILEEII